MNIATRWIGGGLLLAAASTAGGQQPARLAGQAAELEAPAVNRAAIPPQAVVLRADNPAALLRRLPVQRRLDLDAVRAQPVIALEQGEADLSPVLANPASPVNIAARLRQQPQLATVKADVLEVAEIPQGLVVRQFLAYEVGLGSCTDPARRRALEALEIACFDATTPAARADALADPDSPRYLADPRRRARAQAQADATRARQQAAIDRDLAQLRAMLADPGQRAAIEAEIGSAQAARLAALDDAALEAELVNAAEVAIEEVMFVPQVEPRRLDFRHRADFGRTGSPQAAEAELRARDLAPPPGARGPDALRAPPSRPGSVGDIAAGPQLDISEDIALPPKAYLTGFTLGRQHEWSRRVSITIKWCLIGCKRTYYLEPYAGFGYGIGLRLPLRVEGTYRYRHQDGQERAWLVPAFAPFDGSAAQYGEVGLPQAKRYGGQELVAEADGYAGFLYKLPAGIDGNVGAEVALDLTDRLPQPFRDGQFTPPAPGSSTPEVGRTMSDVDLIAGRANFHVVGARIHPAVKFALASNGIAFKLRDHLTGTDQWMTTPGQPYPLSLDSGHRSRFSIGDPVYDLAFVMTPGIEGRVFVDVARWSHVWKWPVWFPQLSVKLPPTGVQFGCHAQTVCSNAHEVRAAYWEPPARMPTAQDDPPAAPTRATVPTRAEPRPERAEPRRTIMQAPPPPPEGRDEDD
ncbi:hypothetical protein [Sphingomicrobium astaxanthinifaciens]|uniref:hypothetical protein n=1 Tax=Sphingomicrobium astaxanthinifaciens TaxID=1227949 RepID=UPI001FCB028F|nr:hypothetical protein [Sphingomicrobium astaxanthinifaciens]MCJ7420983.1 hypothetical protein [Sphingomicrobium astaxanthinifaciens]